MFRNLFISLLSLFVLMTLISCENETIPAGETDLRHSFYPIDSISTWEYRMDSIIYDNDGLRVDSSMTFLRENIIGSFIDVEGDTSYHLEISRKNDPTDQFVVSDLWVLRREANSLQRVEENLNFVKLTFPPIMGSTWNGNLFDELIDVFVAGDPIKVYKNWEYKYLEEIDEMMINGIMFTNVIKVQQADSENNIEKRYSIEYYAEGVGLIKREQQIYDSQKDPTIPWEERTEQGYSLRQTIVNYY